MYFITKYLAELSKILSRVLLIFILKNIASVGIPPKYLFILTGPGRVLAVLHKILFKLLYTPFLAEFAHLHIYTDCS